MVMTEIEIAVPSPLFTDALRRIESVIQLLGLRVTMKGTLTGYPGCTHWHLKLGRQRGTLELTLWPRERRVWFSIHDGRTGEWIGAMAPRLKKAIETCLVNAADGK
jgi:hypothetical protein